jgi:hypothetical protein
MAKIIQTECHYCVKRTFHTVLYDKRIKGDNEYYDESNHYMTLQCGGCQSISFLIRAENPNAFDEDDAYFDINFSGSSAEIPDFNFLREDDQERLPRKIYDLYDEIKAAFKKESKVLAGTGLRMLVEAICLHQKISGKNLAEKIKKLHNNGMISTSELPILDKLRLIGNQSAHDIKAYSIEKLSYALDIINHILISIYILPKINRKLKI